MDASILNAVMSAEGPVVQCVILRSDGTSEEQTVDMTPRLNKPGEILGGAVTFVGQYPEHEIVLMMRKDAPEGTPINKHKLQPPLHKREIAGDMMLVRMDQEAMPQDFTLAMYEKFSALEIEEFEISDSEDEGEAAGGGMASAAALLMADGDDAENDEDDGGFEPEDDEADEDESGDDEDEADDGDMNEDEFRAYLTQRVVENFEAQNGRKPTEEELVPLVDKLQAAMMGAAGDDDEEEATFEVSDEDEAGDTAELEGDDDDDDGA